MAAMTEDTWKRDAILMELGRAVKDVSLAWNPLPTPSQPFFFLPRCLLEL